VPPAVSVIVPARDAQATLAALFDALDAQEPVDGGFEVLLVDDGSVDRTAALARARGATVVRGPAAGPARARNAGAAAAAAPILAFTDADCAPAPGWLATGVRALRDADLVQGAVAPVPGVPVGPYDRTLVVRGEGLYESANLLVRRELFERLGGFESWLRPRRGLELGEDVWFGWSARRAGARVRFCADALVHHAVFPRGPRAFVAERARLRLFPALVARVPELRGVLLWRRLFLSGRSARFDLAVLALAAGLWRRPALLGVLPYLRLVDSDRRLHGRGPAVVRVVADLVGCAALLAGSARARTPVL